MAAFVGRSDVERRLGVPSRPGVRDQRSDQGDELVAVPAGACADLLGHLVVELRGGFGSALRRPWSAVAGPLDGESASEARAPLDTRSPHALFAKRQICGLCNRGNSTTWRVRTIARPSATRFPRVKPVSCQASLSGRCRRGSGPPSCTPAARALTIAVGATDGLVAGEKGGHDG